MNHLGTDQKYSEAYKTSYVTTFVFLKVAWIIIGFIIEIQFLKFVLRWAESTGDYPQWINAGSFWAWVFGFIVFGIAEWITRKIFSLVRAILGGVTKGITEEASDFTQVIVFLVYGMVVYGGVLWLSIFITNKWFDFASSHYEFNDFYAYAGGFMFFMHILFMMGFILPDAKKNS